MSIVADLLFCRTPPLPEVLAPGRNGAIFRHSPDVRVVKPLPGAPHQQVHPGERQQLRKAENQRQILLLIRNGASTAHEVAIKAGLSFSAMTAHLRELENAGLIAVDRKIKPYFLRATK